MTLRDPNTVNVTNIHLHSLHYRLKVLAKGLLELKECSGVVRRAPQAIRMLQVQHPGP